MAKDILVSLLTDIATYSKNLWPKSWAKQRISKIIGIFQTKIQSRQSTQILSCGPDKSVTLHTTMIDAPLTYQKRFTYAMQGYSVPCFSGRPLLWIQCSY